MPTTYRLLALPSLRFGFATLAILYAIRYGLPLAWEACS